jgi:hypothetical protein
MPSAIAAKIQSGRKRSSVERRLSSGTSSGETGTETVEVGRSRGWAPQAVRASPSPRPTAGQALRISSVAAGAAWRAVPVRAAAAVVAR